MRSSAVWPTKAEEQNKKKRCCHDLWRAWRQAQNAAAHTLAGLATILCRCGIISVRQLMCTISFVPNLRGFYLAMNRDEKFTRSTALPPAIVDLADHRAIFPREPEGGTWIAANDDGVCLALINWHRVERQPVRSIASRGQVVKALAAKSSDEEIAAGLAALPLRRLRPFRLIAIIPSEQRVTEWRWDLDRLSTRKHAWESRHWFSSGYNELQAERQRNRICKSAQNDASAGRLSWLRRLHRSHSPKRGPFSICMHRPDAATVSYTEVAVSPRHVAMRYKNGAACSAATTATKSIPRYALHGCCSRGR